MIEKRLLFVCLGNICRSPAAEAVMNGKLKAQGLGQKIRCDSAGIIGNHSGEQADSRMRKQAMKRGYEITSISRKVKGHADFDHFDMIIGMDDQNIRDLNALARTDEERKLIFSFSVFLRLEGEFLQLHPRLQHFHLDCNFFKRMFLSRISKMKANT